MSRRGKVPDRVTAGDANGWKVARGSLSFDAHDGSRETSALTFCPEAEGVVRVHLAEVDRPLQRREHAVGGLTLNVDDVVHRRVCRDGDRLEL